MQIEPRLWHYFLQAPLSLKLILLGLLFASITSWVLILQRILLIRKVKQAYIHFENQFWSGVKLTELYESLPESLPPEQLSSVFYAGFTEFFRLRQNGCQVLTILLEAVARAMRVAQAQAALHLESHPNWLAIVATGSPYLGLLGTILGIMHAFGVLVYAEQTQVLLLIARGLSGALLAIVVSLLTAIPAVIFYNHSASQVERLLNQYTIFQDEFIALLLRQSYEEHHEKLTD